MAFPVEWKKRIPLTIDHTKVGSGGVADFPMLVTGTNLPDAFWSAVASDGKDIRITAADGTTLCSHELVSIDTTAQTLELWAKAPLLLSSSDTVVYLYYDNSTAEMPSVVSQQAVWDEMDAVYHCAESSWDGSLGCVIDSTGKNHATSKFDNNTATGGVIGRCGASGWQYNGRIESPLIGAVWGNPYTISCWAKKGQGGGAMIFIANTSNVGFQGEVAALRSGWYNKVDLVFNDNKVACTAPIDGNAWNMIHAVIVPGSEVTLCVNGQSVAQASWNPAWANNIDAALKGIQQWETPISVDEMRLSLSASSLPRIMTEYANQSSPATFYSVGDAESLGGSRITIPTLGRRGPSLAGRVR